MWIFNDNKKSDVDFINEVLECFLKVFSKNLIIFPTGKIVEILRLICFKIDLTLYLFRILGQLKLLLRYMIMV